MRDGERGREGERRRKGDLFWAGRRPRRSPLGSLHRNPRLCPSSSPALLWLCIIALAHALSASEWGSAGQTRPKLPCRLCTSPQDHENVSFHGPWQTRPKLPCRPCTSPPSAPPCPCIGPYISSIGFRLGGGRGWREWGLSSPLGGAAGSRHTPQPLRPSIRVADPAHARPCGASAAAPSASVIQGGSAWKQARHRSTDPPPPPASPGAGAARPDKPGVGFAQGRFNAALRSDGSESVRIGSESVRFGSESVRI